MNQRGEYGKRSYVGQTFLLKGIGDTLQKTQEAQKLLTTFWQFAKSGNPYDPETAALMHSTLAKLSAVFGLRPR